MCDPTLIGLGLTVGGGVASGVTGSMNRAAQQKALKDAYLLSKAARVSELGRQQGFEQEAVSGWQDANAAMSKTNYDADREAAIQEFMSTVDATPSAVLPEGFKLSGQDDATSEVSAEIARRTAKAAQEARARMTALADLTSYDSAALNRNIALGNNANKLSTVNNLRRGSLGVSNAEQNIAAAQVFPADNILGEILSGAGGALTGASWNNGGLI